MYTNSLFQNQINFVWYQVFDDGCKLKIIFTNCHNECLFKKNSFYSVFDFETVNWARYKNINMTLINAILSILNLTITRSKKNTVINKYSKYLCDNELENHTETCFSQQQHFSLCHGNTLHTL